MPDASSVFNTLPEEMKSDPEMTESVQGDPRSWFHHYKDLLCNSSQQEP